jgi:TolA-binding protein
MEGVKNMSDAIKNIIGEENYKKVTEKLGDIDVISGKYIPINRFNEVNGEKNTLQKQIEKMNLQVESLEGVNTEKEQLTQEIEKMKNDFLQLEKDKLMEMENMSKTSVLREELLKLNVSDTYINLLLNDEKTKNAIKESKVINNKVDGIDNIINSLKENYKDVFPEIIKENNGNNKGNNGNNNGSGDNDWSKVVDNILKNV